MDDWCEEDIRRLWAWEWRERANGDNGAQSNELVNRIPSGAGFEVLREHTAEFAAL